MANGRKPPTTRRAAADTSLRSMMDVVRRLNSQSETQKVIDLVLQEVVRSCNALRGNLIIYKGSKARQKSSVNLTGRPPRTADQRIFIRAIRGVMESGKRICRTDAGKATGIRLPAPLSVLCVPLRVKDISVGCIYLDHPGVAGVFGDRQIEIAEFLAEHAAVAIENTQLHRERVRDKLTKAYNHAHFEHRLRSEVERARRHGYACGMLMIDVDDFKAINDTHGHETGNVILCHVANTLRDTVRAADLVGRPDRRAGEALVARFGGDEFEVLLPATDREGTRRTGERLVAALGGTRLVVATGRLTLSISVGGAVYPEDAADAVSLKARADEALYASKRAGKNRSAMYLR